MVPEEQKPSGRYLVYGLLIESEVELTSTPVVDRAAEPATVRIARGSPDYFHSLRPAGQSNPEDWVQHFVLADGGIYMRADAAFEATVSADGGSVVCRSLGGVDERSLEANLLNFVISASLTLRGEEPLHATVVELQSKAIGLLGLSGAGKSTLAAFLISRGADLVTDDMLRIAAEHDSILAYPGPYRLKLLGEPARSFLPKAAERGYFNLLSGKVMVQPRERATLRRAPTPLAALFHLGQPPDPSIAPGVASRRLTGVDFARAVLSSAMDNRYIKADRLTRQLQFADRMAASLPLFELNYPRRTEFLPAVEMEILRNLR